MAERSDEDLMKAYAAGDEEGFKELYARYDGRLSRFLDQRLPRRSESFLSDLFQITWLKIHQARERFDESQKFSTWFFTIALNTLRDHCREKWGRDRCELLDSAPAGNQDAEQMMLTREALNELKGQLELLPTSQREVLLLSDGEGFQTKEISAMLQMTEGAVRQMLFRARSAVREAMKGSHGN